MRNKLYSCIGSPDLARIQNLFSPLHSQKQESFIVSELSLETTNKIIWDVRVWKLNTYCLRKENIIATIVFYFFWRSCTYDAHSSK